MQVMLFFICEKRETFSRNCEKRDEKEKGGTFMYVTGFYPWFIKWFLK